MKRERGIAVSTLVISLISTGIVMIMAFIKIYIGNKIYYESRKVNAIEANVAALKEENSILATRVERLKYKSRISDTIFPMDSPQNESENDESQEDEKSPPDGE